MFTLTREDGIQPCPHCGGAKVNVCHQHTNLRKPPRKAQLKADGSILTRYYVIEAECVCTRCHARGPRLKFYLPDGVTDYETFHKRDLTAPLLIESLIELWNFRHPRDGELKLIEYRPMLSEGEA